MTAVSSFLRPLVGESTLVNNVRKLYSDLEFSAFLYNPLRHAAE